MDSKTWWKLCVRHTFKYCGYTYPEKDFNK